MGGDYAPLEAILGVKQFLSAGYKGKLALVGDEKQLKELLSQHHLESPGISIIASSQVIGMHESPTRALKEKQDSSILKGFKLLASGQADAFISAGNTGAMLVGALFHTRTLSGVLRPAISTIIPKTNGRTGLLLDVGLNADCKPEQLNQFAIMGAVYAKLILQITDPAVALINIGEEEGKGNLLAQAVYPLLKNNKHIRFIGNTEGREIFTGEADVMVCDGFTGNVILKLAESFYDISKQRNIHDAYLDQFNFENYGGTPVLGIDKPVIIGHGISGAAAFCNMLKLAKTIIERKLMENLESALRD